MRHSILMRSIFAATALLLAGAGSAAAGYDDSWYITDFWSGEYPGGFAVAAPNVAVPARPEMDKDLPASLSCPLPYKAMFSPWNEERTRLSEARFVTASKIVPLTALAAFEFQPDDGSAPVPIQQGETIEHLIYGAEGAFLARIRGREYTAYPDLFDRVDPVPDDAFVQDEWLQLRCEDGALAWILISDLQQAGEDEFPRLLTGLWPFTAGGPGFIDYGEVRDLTDAEIAAGDPTQP